MRPGIALLGMAALLLAMLGRMGALDWLPGVASAVAIMVGVTLVMIVPIVIVGAVVMAPLLGLFAFVNWIWPVAKPGGGTA